MTPTQELVLDCYRSPVLLRSMSDKSVPLPEGLERLFRISAPITCGEYFNNWNQPQFVEIRAATLLFVKEVVLIKDGDHYRTLGLRSNASPEQLNSNYRLLLSLLSSDAKESTSEIRLKIERISSAYKVLSKDKERCDYDCSLFPENVEADFESDVDADVDLEDIPVDAVVSAIMEEEYPCGKESSQVNGIWLPGDRKAEKSKTWPGEVANTVDVSSVQENRASSLRQNNQQLEAPSISIRRLVFASITFVMILAIIWSLIRFFPGLTPIILFLL